jgi:hypothetical protein
MQAVKAHFRDGQVNLLEPILNVTEADLFVIVLDSRTEIKNNSNAGFELDAESLSLLKMQSYSGFAQEVLLDPAEEVWNGL